MSTAVLGSRQRHAVRNCDNAGVWSGAVDVVRQTKATRRLCLSHYLYCAGPHAGAVTVAYCTPLTTLKHRCAHSERAAGDNSIKQKRCTRRRRNHRRPADDSRSVVESDWFVAVSRLNPLRAAVVRRCVRKRSTATAVVDRPSRPHESIVSTFSAPDEPLLCRPRRCLL